MIFQAYLTFLKANISLNTLRERCESTTRNEKQGIALHLRQSTLQNDLLHEQNYWASHEHTAAYHL